MGQIVEDKSLPFNALCRRAHNLLPSQPPENRAERRGIHDAAIYFPTHAPTTLYTLLAADCDWAWNWNYWGGYVDVDMAMAVCVWLMLLLPALHSTLHSPLGCTTNATATDETRAKHTTTYTQRGVSRNARVFVYCLLLLCWWLKTLFKRKFCSIVWCGLYGLQLQLNRH